MSQNKNMNLNKRLEYQLPSTICLESVLRISECNLTTVNSEWKYLVALFPYYRLYLITDGEAKVQLRDQIVTLRKGYLYLIPQFSVASSECENTMTHYWLHFTLDDTMINFLTIYKPLLEVKASEEDYKIYELIKKSFDESEKNKDDTSSLLACESLTKYLFSKFLTRSQINFEAAKFIPVLKYIDAHINENITNEELSGIMYLNPTYFSNAFTKQFEVSPKKYILRKKMNMACKMLIENKNTIKEIAYSLGFDNEMYFSRIFSKYLGISPGKYRNLLVEK